MRIELVLHGAARGAHGSPRARAERSRRSAMSSAAASARGRDVSMLPGLFRAPRLRGRSNIFPGKRGRTCPFPRDGPPPLADEPRRASVPPVPPDRARGPGTPETAVAPPPSPPRRSRAPLDPRRTRTAAYPKSLTERGTDVSSFEQSNSVPRACAIRRAEPRPPAGVRAMHRDRAPRATMDARAAPRRARARAAPTWPRAAPERRGEKESRARHARRVRQARLAALEPPSRLREVMRPVARPRTRRARRRCARRRGSATAPRGALRRRLGCGGTPRAAMRARREGAFAREACFALADPTLVPVAADAPTRDAPVVRRQKNERSENERPARFPRFRRMAIRASRRRCASGFPHPTPGTRRVPRGGRRALGALLLFGTHRTRSARRTGARRRRRLGPRGSGSGACRGGVADVRRPRAACCAARRRRRAAATAPPPRGCAAEGERRSVGARVKGTMAGIAATGGGGGGGAPRRERRRRRTSRTPTPFGSAAVLAGPLPTTRDPRPGRCRQAQGRAPPRVGDAAPARGRDVRGAGARAWRRRGATQVGSVHVSVLVTEASRRAAPRATPSGQRCRSEML